MNIKKTINVCLSCVGGILIFDFIQSLKSKDFKVSITGMIKIKMHQEKYYVINFTDK